MSNTSTCTSCGRRFAVYFRRASGERLCSVCFERSLVKAIKRSLRNVKELTPGTSILSVIIPERLVESITLLYLLNKIERKYRCDVIATLVTCVDFTSSDIIKLLEFNKLASAENVILLQLSERYCLSLDPQTFKYVIRLYGKIATSVNTNIVALPLTLNDVDELVINSLLSGDLNNALITQPINLNNIIITMPFFKVPANEIYAFSYLKGLYNYSLDSLIPIRSCSVRQAIIKELVRDMIVNNPELTQTLSKFIEDAISKFKVHKLVIADTSESIRN